MFNGSSGPDDYTGQLARIQNSDFNSSFQIAAVNICPCNTGFRHTEGFLNR
jgi:hypothetical protein